MPALSRTSTSMFSVLVFSRTEGYRHDSIPAGIAGLKDLAAQSQSSTTPFSIHACEDTIVFNPSTLAQYRVIVFLQASGEFFDNEAQLIALKDFVRGGGGIVGIHCASTGLPSSEWYRRLIGAVVTDHPEPQKGEVVVEDPNHPILSYGSALQRARESSTEYQSSRHAGPDISALHFEWLDEWYNFAKNPRAENGVHVLMTAKESSYKGGKMGKDHPVAWCQEIDGSRSFYTSLGHFDEAYQDVSFMSQILNGILWAARLRT